MDFSYLERLAKQASEISLYDIKTVVNKAKNVVLNLSEIEGKVREATNDDAWGASSTVMMEIAQATFNFQLFNEIMPTIYQRFTEKEARQWRQIYKALVLLEFLVKNGSERVIDDARSHLSLIKVLRNFHYTDEGGKDQGINVRNRSRELAELLADLDKVRVERRKAKANRNKYTGVGNDAGGGPSFQSEGSRYGGFGSDSFSENGNGSGSGGRGGRSSSYNDAPSRGNTGEFEEYDAGEWEEAGSAPPRRSNSTTTSSSSNYRTKAPAPAPKPSPVPAVVHKEVNLFDFDDEEQSAPAPVPKLTFAANSLADDDFDDFQSAPGGFSPPAAAPAKMPNAFDLLNATSAPSPSYGASPISATRSLPPPLSYNTTSMMPALTSSASYSTPAASSTVTQSTTRGNAPAAAKPASDFSDLFSFGPTPTSSSSATKTAAGATSMASMAQQRGTDSLFGSSGASGRKEDAGGWDSLI